MTTYNLRSASPAKTRADAVVVGVVQPDKGVRLAPGGEDVAKAYGRKFRPLLATLGFTGKAGEVAKVPTGGAISSPLLVLVGLGKDPGHVDGPPGCRCRSAGGHQRHVRRAGPPGGHARAGPGGDRGLRARRLHVHDVQEGARSRRRRAPSPCPC